MKKLIPFFFIFTLFIASIGVSADIIWEPEDDFYWAHSEECEYIDRRFVAASSDTAVNVYKSPEDGTLITTVLNGEELYIAWRWEDWYYYDIGWIHSDDVALIYDSEAFLADHETSDYSGEAFSIQSAQLYTYPNSGESYELIENTDYMLIGEAFALSYIDEAGREWGQITYYMQHAGWVCIDDPTNTELSDFVIPTAESVSQERGRDALPPVTPFSFFLILLVATPLVIIVVAVTAIILIKKNKAKK